MTQIDRSRRRRRARRILLLLAVLAICLMALVRYVTGRAETAAKPKTITSAPLPLVCIDPGHPSESNSGKTVQNGVTELDINWQVAEKLKSILKQNKNIRVAKTRDECDRYMRNSARAKAANRMGASLVVHLHCDTGSGRGFTIYHPDREGHAEGEVGPSPEVIESSKLAAQTLRKSMAEILKDSLRDRGIRGDSSTYWGSRNGALTCSIFSKVPTVTVEMVFLSNPSDAKFISSDAGRDKMAEALAAGILNHLESAGSTSPPQPTEQ